MEVRRQSNGGTGMIASSSTFRPHPGRVVVVVNLCFTSLFGTKGLLSDIVIR